MGLAERRVIQSFQANELPELERQVTEAAGFQVPMEVRWDTMAPDGESHNYSESWKSVYFEPLIAALKTVARDDLGREALKAGLKSISIGNSSANYYPENWARFAGGALTLDHEPLTNAYNVEGRTAELVKALEGGL